MYKFTQKLIKKTFERINLKIGIYWVTKMNKFNRF